MSLLEASFQGFARKMWEIAMDKPRDFKVGAQWEILVINTDCSTLQKQNSRKRFSLSQEAITCPFRQSNIHSDWKEKKRPPMNASGTTKLPLIFMFLVCLCFLNATLQIVIAYISKMWKSSRFSCSDLPVEWTVLEFPIIIDLASIPHNPFPSIPCYNKATDNLSVP